MRYVVVAKPTAANDRPQDVAGEDIRVVESVSDRKGTVQPWRLSVDLPRAGMVTAIMGVGYLL